MSQSFMIWGAHRQQRAQQAEQQVEALKRALETYISDHGLPNKGAVERYCQRIGMTLDIGTESGVSFFYPDTLTLYQAIEETPMPILLRQYI